MYAPIDLRNNLMEANPVNYNQEPETQIYFYPGNNPVLATNTSPFVLQFKQTKDSLLNVDDYKAFLENAIMRFRKSRFYKNYKSYLISLGFDRCQVHGNISSEMATIEMHHNMLTIFDIAYIITSHVINTSNDGITTNDLVYLLKKVHREHKVQLVMLSLTPDQLHIPPSMCFGDWFSFLKEYRYGISKDIAFKIIFYLKEFENDDFGNNYDILKIRDEIMEWSEYNERIDNSQLYRMYDPIQSNAMPGYMGQPIEAW